MTTLLPPGKSQFSDANGVPLAGGSVTMYIPGTTTFKNTWLDPSQLALNTNPVILDASGEAVIYGVGAYRQIVKDSLGNLIWDQLTASTDTGGVYSGGTSTGTANNQIVLSPSPAGFSLTAGNFITFIAGFTNTGPATLNANGTGAKPILKPGPSGPAALIGGEIAVGNAVELFYDGTQYQLLNPASDEGSWTPTFVGTGTAGSFTYTNQIGRYIRRGNLVWVECRVTISAISVSPAGNMTIAGLPFTASTLTGMNTALAVGFVGGVNFKVNFTAMGAAISNAASGIALYTLGSSQAVTILQGDSIASTCDIAVSGIYRMN